MIKVWFDSFWGTFDKNDNFFVWILSSIDHVEVTPENPDIIFTDNRNYIRTGNTLTVYFSAEPFYYINDCDFAMTSFHIDDPRFITIPLYSLYAYELYKNKVIPKFDSIKIKDQQIKSFNEKPFFCAYISGGIGGPKSPREHYVNLISSYKRVDCAGKHLNNCPIVPGDPGSTDGSINKVNFLKPYKFAFAIENNEDFNGEIGYTTEKIYEPMAAGCIPIYWGNPKIEEQFNTGSFINTRNYSDQELLDLIISIDKNYDQYIDYLLTPYLNSENYYLNKDHWIDTFKKLFCKI